MPFRIAQLSGDQMQELRDMEQNLGKVLIAYEQPAGGTAHAGATSSLDEEDSVLDGLVDTYRTHDPD